MKKRTKLAFQALVLVTLISVGSWIELPYFYQTPGSAIELAPIVSVAGGYHEEKGALMMTTVSLNRTNVWEYLYANVNPQMELLEVKQVKAHNETDEQYFQRQKVNMVRSQQKAIKVAFEKAHIPIQIKEEGAMVQFFIAGMTAEKVLEPGDTIIAVDQQPIYTSEALTKTLNAKKAGEKANLTVMRDTKTLELDIELVLFPEQYQTTGEKRAGIGILSPETKLTITPSKEVTFSTEDIGGPSAGLMFTLELINQLTEQDITNGRRIAGTGTMELDGSVGPIGGAKHKVIAADRAGAQVFFAPDDGTPTSNYQEALKSATDKGLKIEVVPITSIQDALDYLNVAS